MAPPDELTPSEIIRTEKRGDVNAIIEEKKIQNNKKFFSDFVSGLGASKQPH
jgi:hypothetical protein